ELTTIANFSFTWGVPFTFETAFHTNAPTCCNGASLLADLYNSARLSGIHPSLTTGPEITDFTVTSSSGTHYTRDGVPAPPAAVPVPPIFRGFAAAALLAAGAWRLRRRVMTRRRSCS